jgi:transposase
MDIPGADWVVAAALIAEVGADMSLFRSVRHLAASPGVRPGSYERAGKHKSARARKGNVHLRTTLVGAATPASRTKGSYLKDRFYRPKGPLRHAASYPRHRYTDPRRRLSPQVSLSQLANLSGERTKSCCLSSSLLRLLRNCR